MLTGRMFIADLVATMPTPSSWLCLLLVGLVCSRLYVYGYNWPEREEEDDDEDDAYYENIYTHNLDVIRARLLDFSCSTALPSFDRNVRALNISAVCRKALRTMLEHPEREWAALMLDSNGRLLKPGLLSGSLTDFGDYEQCMSVVAHSDVSLAAQSGVLTARYCLLSARPPIPPPSVELNFSRTKYAHSWVARRFATPTYRLYYRIVNALCFPSMCQPYEIERLAQRYLAQFNLNISVEACQLAGEPQPLDAAQTGALFVLGFCVLATILGTILELRDRSLAKKQARSQSQAQPPRNLEQESRQVSKNFWRCFSLLRNTRVLFTINEPSTGDLSPIHGLRVLLIGWVITCHTTNFAPLGLFDQPMIAARFAEAINIARELVTQFVISGSLSVQSFFIISGVISLHTALIDKDYFRREMSYLKYVFLRWFRFAPPLLGMYCYMFLWPRLVSGPMAHWDYLKINQQPCYDRWWHSFLFFNNWDSLLEMCGSHTWFLSADFQINLFAYFLVAVYVRNYQLGLRLNQAALALATIAPTIVSIAYRVPLVHILEPDIEKLNYVYSMTEFNTYNHVAAYLAGVLIAAYLHQRPRPPSPSRASTTRTLIWVSLALLLVVPFSTYPFIAMEKIPDSFLPLVYTGMKRTLWIASLSWIIYVSCTVSRHTLMGQILSARVWQPVSRLTFCIYLTQSLSVWVYAYNLKHTVSISHLNTFHRIGGNMLYSVFFAFWLYVLFEAPSVNLVKLTIKRKRKPTEMVEMNNNNRKADAHKLIAPSGEEQSS